MKNKNQTLERVVVLDDDLFFLDYFKEILEPEVSELSLYQCEGDFFDIENALSLSVTELIILDYRLRNTTIVSLKILELLRHDLNYKGAILVVSTLNHFAFDQEILDSLATACVDKEDLTWPKLLEASGISL